MSEAIKICPFLGMAKDPATNTSFPSLWNLCHKAKPPEPAEFRHQQEYCLAENHVNCTVFQQQERKALPPYLRIPHNLAGAQRTFNWKIIPLVIIMLALLFFGWFKVLSNPRDTETKAVLTSQAKGAELTAIALAATKTPTPTPSLQPTKSELELAIIAALTQTAAATLEPSATITPTPTNTQRPANTVAPPSSSSKPKPKPKTPLPPPADTPVVP